MSRIKRVYQGGSMTTFIIVGVIIAVGLIGTIYFVRQHGEQVRKEQVIATVDKQEKVDKTVVKEEDNATNSDDKTSTSSELPVTGSELSIVNMFSICLLTMTLTSYVLSRRYLKYSL